MTSTLSGVYFVIFHLSKCLLCGHSQDSCVLCNFLLYQMFVLYYLHVPGVHCVISHVYQVFVFCYFYQHHVFVL